MQTFIRLSSGKTITFEFENGKTTIQELKYMIADRESYPDYLISHMILQNLSDTVFENDHILTKDEFGDNVSVLIIIP